MLSLDLDAVTGAELQQLCESQCPESLRLEFKRDLPGSSDKEKHEFLKDVSGLANADGGDLVYGVAELDGVASSLSPITSEPFDAAQRRLGQMLDASIEPRIAGVKLRQVVCDGGYCLVIRVPASFEGPHRFHVNHNSKFAVRSGTHTSEMTYPQLRSAFDRTATLAEQARHFIEGRISLISQRKNGRPMVVGPICTVHVVPLAAMARRASIDIAALVGDYVRFMGSDWGGASRVRNLDGLLVHSGGIRGNDLLIDYVQIFRNGAFEAARHGGMLRSLDAQERIIPSTTITCFYRDSIRMFMQAAKSFGIAGPAIVQCALLGVDGYEFGVAGSFSRWNKAYSDRADLVLPDVWVDAIDDLSSLDEHVRPMMDILWQAFDVDRCIEYSADGTWQPRA